MIMTIIGRIAVALAVAAAIVPLSEAQAELVLSQLVVDLQPGKQARQDIEVINRGEDVLYVAVEPREIIGAGTSQTSSRHEPDPQSLGLLVSPSRMVLDAGERKLLRIATISEEANREQVYRVTVKPVVGEVSAERGGLKILVGYDVLVLVRPTTMRPQVTGTRSGNLLTLRNVGNVSVELTNGKQCDAQGKRCDALPAGRLYAGAEKSVTVDPARPATFTAKVSSQVFPLRF